MGIILIIGLERYCGIVYPLRRGMTWKITITCLTVNFVLSLMFVIPRFLTLNINKQSLQCSELQDWSKINGLRHISSVTYNWVILAVYFITPVTVISCLYVRMFRSLSDFQMTGNTGKQNKCDIQRRNRNRRTIVLLSLVLGAFIMCTLPNKLRWMLMSYYVENVSHPVAHVITEIMHCVHVSINPFIYVVVDRNFRRILSLKVRSILGRCFRDKNGRKSVVGGRTSVISTSNQVTETFELSSPKSSVYNQSN